MKQRADYRRMARQTLEGQYWRVFAVLFILTLIISAVTATIVGFLFVGAIAAGMSAYLLKLTQKESMDEFDVIINTAKNSFLESLVAHVLISIFTFLWSLLFIVPGIIKALSWSQTYYILAENPKMNAQEAMKRSEQMMNGHKARMFGLLLSFIGWYILCILTFGIGFIFLYPYIQVTLAHFYNDLKEQPQLINN